MYQNAIVLVRAQNLSGDALSMSMRNALITGAARGQAELAQSNYSASYADFQKAVQANPSSASQVAYPEFYAGYKAGKSKSELIPLLHDLITVAQNAKGNDFAAADAARYQSYIDDLNAGEALDI